MRTFEAAMAGQESAVIVGAIGVAAALLHYFATARKVKRLSGLRSISPRPAPPDDISPAAARCLLLRWSDEFAVAASLVSAAVKGAIAIGRREGQWSIRANPANDGELAREERTLSSRLLESSDDFSFHSKDHKKLEDAWDAVDASLLSQYGAASFHTDVPARRRGILILVIALLGSLAVLSAGMGVIATLFALTFSLFVLLEAGMLMAVFASFAKLAAPALAGATGKMGSTRVRAWAESALAIFGVLMLPTFVLVPMLVAGSDLPFFGFIVSVIAGTSTESLPPVFVVPLALIFIVIYLAHRSAAGYTDTGLDLARSALGLKAYLASAPESDSISIAQWEKLLPYAIALDEGDAWLGRLAQGKVTGGEDYSPSWYQRNDDKPISQTLPALWRSLPAEIARNAEPGRR